MTEEFEKRLFVVGAQRGRIMPACCPHPDAFFFAPRVAQGELPGLWALDAFPTRQELPRS